MYLRASDPKSSDYEDKMIAIFLVGSAGRMNEHARACGAYKRFSHKLDIANNVDLMQLLLLSAKKTGHQDIVDEVSALLPDSADQPNGDT